MFLAKLSILLNYHYLVASVLKNIFILHDNEIHQACFSG